ncbi:unnamed protein product [Ectocarpus sp. 6 AP-2014]
MTKYNTLAGRGMRKSRPDSTYDSRSLGEATEVCLSRKNRRETEARVFQRLG